MYRKYLSMKEEKNKRNAKVSNSNKTNKLIYLDKEKLKIEKTENNSNEQKLNKFKLAGTAILLTDHGFLNYCEEELAGCLRPESVGTDLLSDRAERAERRLAELGRKAEQRGGRHMGAVWILPVKGEAIWSKGKQSKETVQME